LTVARVTARPVVLRLARPIVARIATITDWPVILVDLHTEEGVVGRSYLEPYTVRAMKYLVPALEDLGEVLRGRRVSPVELYGLARKSLHFVGYQGMSMIAVSAIDMAAWDALAKAVGVPLCVLLGGSIGSVPAYNSNGLWLKDPSALGEEAIALRDEGGFRALKLRLGRERARDDVAAIEAVRQSVGEEMRLMADFNQGLNRAEAIERCHMVDAERLDWIEEPLVYDDLEGHAQLAAQLATPIQIGENFSLPEQMSEALLAKACDLVMPDLERIGGVTGWQRAAALAAERKLPMSSHLFPETSAHLLAITPTCHYLEYVDWADAILAEPLKIVEGDAVIPDRAGTGVGWNEEAVKRYLIA
jgi:mandelate racemase